MFDSSGDIRLTETGDIILGDSVRQAVLIRLRWILGEWRFDPDFGFPVFEDVLVKNPDIQTIKADVLETVLSVDGVDECTINDVVTSLPDRKMFIKFRFSVGDDVYNEEVELSA